MPECISATGSDPLSIIAAADEVPRKTAVIEGGRRISYAELARAVSGRTASLERPAPGRPAFLTAGSDFTGLVDLLALLEKDIPAVLFSPKLTDAEKTALRRQAEEIAEPLPEGTAFVVFTSGTTGRPKPAVLTRRSLAAGALAAAEALRMTPDDVFQLSLSPARVGGLGIVLRTLAVRGTLSLAPRFCGAAFPETLQRDGVTLASLVPAMLADVFEKNPGWRSPAGLRALLIGGAPMPAKLRAEAARRGVPVVTTYGMTETGSSSGISAWEERLQPVSSGEVPLRGVRYREKNGEILLSGPMLFDGYWGRPAVVREGWFATGDAGTVDAEGRVRILARQSDLIITGGEKVVPAEVESVLESLPGIREALVLGMPDEKWGQIVTALLVPENGCRLSASRLETYLSERLARWKSPRRIAWVQSIPLTPAGKRLRNPDVLCGLETESLHYSLNHRST